MSTFVIIGAGSGLGIAAARRFGREGFDVALISRVQDHVSQLASELTEEGITAGGFAADVLDRESLGAALDEVARELGPIEVLQYSPVPHREFLRPVLETDVADLGAAME
ncbi:MAG: SDR family oxidoreductase, partial [Bifidobacterium crudilactis]